LNFIFVIYLSSVYTGLRFIQSLV